MSAGIGLEIAKALAIQGGQLLHVKDDVLAPVDDIVEKNRMALRFDR